MGVDRAWVRSTEVAPAGLEGCWLDGGCAEERGAEVVERAADDAVVGSTGRARSPPLVPVEPGSWAGMLGGAVQLLHQRPDQRRLLTDNPVLIPDAVDEFLRLTSPVQCLGRTVTRDVRVDDTAIPEGRRVLLLYGSANRDERQYGSEAGELDVTRRPAKILTFSHGAHHCLGAAAARMQSRVTLTELLSRCPDFEVDEDAIVWAGGSYVRRPLSVPFTVTR